MSNRIATLAAAALALSALAAPALAEEPGAAYNVKTVGALAFETRGVATDATQVGRQGGFLVPASVQWTKTPAEPVSGAVIGAGSTGALTLETLGLATSAADVRHQGGAATAGAVRWTSAPAR